MQIELFCCLKALNFDSIMLKMVIGTKVPQFPSFCPKSPSVRPHSGRVWSHISSEVAHLVRGRTVGQNGLNSDLHCTRPHSRLSWPKSVISSFACSIQLIPVPMVLVKIINGKFGIIEMFGNPQRVFWSFDDHFCNKFCRIQRKEVSRRRISRSSKRSQSFYKLR